MTRLLLFSVGVRRIDRYQTKLDDFYHEFKASTEKQERAVCQATEKWIHRLISFIPRKTIKGPQREALYDWIQEELTILESNPFNPVDSIALRESFNQALLALPSNKADVDVMTAYSSPITLKKRPILEQLMRKSFSLERPLDVMAKHMNG
nr:hypothetical protein [Vibrio cyclitrophicus]